MVVLVEQFEVTKAITVLHKSISAVRYMLHFKLVIYSFHHILSDETVASNHKCDQKHDILKKKTPNLNEI